uniref:Rapid ALkalinization Factor n=1 Tax=Populus trichocarpa TaxID=3694 RepID=A0A2K1X5U2_POPTR
MKSLSLSALTLSSLLLTMMLLNTKSCGASISLPEMDGDVPLYSIADSNLDLEFMMDSEINRILGSRNAGVDPLIRQKPVFGCGRGNRYCVPKGPDNTRKCGSQYKRDC